MKVFLLAGKASSGKDLLGEYIKETYDSRNMNTCILHLTTPLYEYAKNYFSWNGNMNEKPREFFQEMGIEVIQNQLGKKTFLIDRLCEDIEILKNFFDVFVITDGRLIREFEELKKRFPDINVIHVVRENYDNNLSDKEKNHITETELDKYQDYDYTVFNTSKEDLLEQARKIIEELDGDVL